MSPVQTTSEIVVHFLYRRNTPWNNLQPFLRNDESNWYFETTNPINIQIQHTIFKYLPGNSGIRVPIYNNTPYKLRTKRNRTINAVLFISFINPLSTHTNQERITLYKKWTILLSTIQTTAGNATQAATQYKQQRNTSSNASGNTSYNTSCSASNKQFIHTLMPH